MVSGSNSMERSRMFPQAQGITDNNSSRSDMVWTPWWTAQYNPELWRAALYRRASETELNLGSGQLHLPTHPDNSAAPKTVINSDTAKSPVKRKRGSPWTPQEHRAFLRGLKEYGKGDWKSIARYCVVSKTSTQVASHAQKYFLRNDGANKKKRASIHDITLESEHLVEVDQQQHKPEPKPENPIQQLHNDSVSHQQNTIQGWLKEIDLPDLVEDQPQKTWSYNYNNLPNNWNVSEDPFYCQMLQDSQMMHFKPPQDNANMPPDMRG